MFNQIIASAVLVLSLATSVGAQGLDPASADALSKTLEFLLNPAARNAEIAKDPAKTKADQQVRTLAGSDALTQEFYVLAGEILAELVQNTGGDPQKMTQAVEQAKNDPSGFATMLSPTIQQRLRELSRKLPDKR